ncbi:orotate phosphoribosyltransferase [Proteiniclasticum sp. BAD-10]|uniref:Orotate phosphoribosyltransferase n=1 Tax=Proteiniclasticum sediminis TaxID=2804028 RepID=A0A941HPG2_9CLOT|nr:orotate phosphoribosyltransferase [Proteiniclasticum sediminis]MBR0575020.1 orotate phosphoribosyltransferase [Proteiniclasticum sediminis]
MREIAEGLLDIGAVALSVDKPFTWASGIQSPIYCDNRLLLSTPATWKKVIAAMIEVLEKEFPDAQCLMGTATAGIPHASVCAYTMNLPGGFVRGKAKDHGKENRIEGRVAPGMKVVVIEDLISTGGSSLDAVKALEDAGCEVLGIAAIFTYGMEKANRAMAEHSVKLVSLATYPELLQAARESRRISGDDQRRLEIFMANPASPDWMR